MTEPGIDAFNDRELDAALSTQGPLATDLAHRLVARGRARLDAGEALLAIGDFRRVIGHEDPGVTGAALVGLGDAIYRLDDERQAKAAWEAATRLRDNPSTYQAWRNLAGALVREGNLQAAIQAYREADRRAPAEDKAEIASRLGWLTKETGNSGAAGRYFARSRGGAGIGAAQLLVLLTSVVSVIALSLPENDLFLKLALVPDAVRHGDLWQLVTVALIHAPGPVRGLPQLSIHLALNMYVLWIIGPIVESIWGRWLFLGFYVLCAIAGSTASLLFSNSVAVGASGAIFGLVGIVLAGTRVHHPMLDRRARSVVPQLGMFILINLVFGFAVNGAGGNLDIAAHIGGLVAGLWLGLLVPPGKAPTLRSAWQHPRGAATQRSPILIAAGLVGLLGVIAVGLAMAGATL